MAAVIIYAYRSSNTQPIPVPNTQAAATPARARARASESSLVLASPAAPSVPVTPAAPAVPVTPAAPLCRRCDEPLTRRITRSSNRTGNAGRPYYRCNGCNTFGCWDDDRGVDPIRNPLCDCGIPSRRQVAGPQKNVPWGLHYVCLKGMCDYYEEAREEGTQKQVRLDRELVECLKGLKLI